MQIRIQRRELALKVDSNVFIRVYISTLLGSLKTGATVALNYRKTHKEASNQLCLTQQAQHRHGSAAEPRSLGRDLRGRSVASSGRRAARPAARRALSTGRGPRGRREEELHRRDELEEEGADLRREVSNVVQTRARAARILMFFVHTHPQTMIADDVLACAAEIRLKLYLHFGV